MNRRQRLEKLREKQEQKQKKIMKPNNVCNLTVC